MFNGSESGPFDRRNWRSRAAKRLCASLLIGFAWGCRENPSESTGGSNLPAGSLSPRRAAASEVLSIEEVAARIHALRVAGRVHELETHVVTARRAEVVAMLQAVDRLLEANGRVLRLADGRFGRGAAVPWDLGAIRNNLGLLSESVRIVRHEEQGDTGRVLLQEGDNVPLVSERFERVDGRWMYAPEAIDLKVVEQLRRITRIVDQIADRIAAGQLTVELMDESYRLRVVPLVNELDLLIREQKPIGRRE
jgi:hypothetical protein